MPEITQADREAAKELMYRKWYGLSDAAYEEMFCQAFAAHRTAAAEAAKAGVVEHLRSLAEVVQKTWGVAEANGFQMAIEEIERMGAVESTPTPLTADAVKRMQLLLHWFVGHANTSLMMDHHRRDESWHIDMAAKVAEADALLKSAKLIESLGVTAEVGHGT